MLSDFWICNWYCDFSVLESLDLVFLCRKKHFCFIPAASYRLIHLLLVQHLAIYYFVKATDWLTLSTSRWLELSCFWALAFVLSVGCWASSSTSSPWVFGPHVSALFWSALWLRDCAFHTSLFTLVVSCLLSSTLQSSFPCLLRETLYPGLGLQHLPRQ